MTKFNFLGQKKTFKKFVPIFKFLYSWFLVFLVRKKFFPLSKDQTSNQRQSYDCQNSN